MGSAVLLGAGEVVEGGDLGTSRRGDVPARDLARGPARLTVALGIGRDANGLDACDPSSALRVRRGRGGSGPGLTRPRLGVSSGAHTPGRVLGRGGAPGAPPPPPPSQTPARPPPPPPSPPLA